MKKMHSKNTYIVLVLMFVAGIASAQPGFNKVQTANRNILNTKQSRAGLVGEPYLYKDFKKAMVKFNGGTSSPGYYEVKYDQLEDILVVKGKDIDEELTFSDPVAEFKFDDNGRIFRNGFNAVDKATDKSYYEVLYDGKVKYLKRIGKVIIEAKEFNSATVTKKIENDIVLYLVKEDKTPMSVKANEKSVLKVLGKETELSKYIKENKLNLKNDADLGKLLAYYETLIV